MLTIDLYPERKMNSEMTPIDFGFVKVKDMTQRIIKVIGVGGGGSNAVKSLYEKGVEHVGMAVCNTDSQALSQSPVPIKVQLGDKGLGVGGDPKLGRQYAEESLDDICRLFDEETQMVFITAGMGGGTGTGAAPVIARAARERGILTIGVVTLPFRFEMTPRINKALEGVEVLKNEVDSLLVINNERLLEIYDDGMTTMEEAFLRVDDVLSTATKSIAEIITVNGIVNRDFRDVEFVLKNGGSAIMSIGYGEGDNRLLKAMNNALESPLLNKVDMSKIRRLLYVIYESKDARVTVTETTEINRFMDDLSSNMEVLWGHYPDETLGEKVKVALVATGFDKDGTEDDNDSEQPSSLEELRRFYYPEKNLGKETKRETKEAGVSDEECEVTQQSDVTSVSNSDIVDVDTDEADDSEDMPVKSNWFAWLKRKIVDSLNDE